MIENGWLFYVHHYAVSVNWGNTFFTLGLLGLAVFILWAISNFSHYVGRCSAFEQLDIFEPRPLKLLEDDERRLWGWQRSWKTPHRRYYEGNYRGTGL